MTTEIPILQRCSEYQDRIAIIDEQGKYTYATLLQDAQQVTHHLLSANRSLQEQPICFLVPPQYTYVQTQWGIWLSGGIAVPLAVSHPLAELEYVLEDTGTSFLIYHPIFEEKALALAEKFSIQLINILELPKVDINIALPEVQSGQGAMMVYTSGTTGKPKGVVTTHDNITAHIKALSEAWHWQKEDRIVNILPLHHVHGIVNVVASALWNGATCFMLSKFDLEKIWQLVEEDQLSVFMAVPTIYAKMIADYKTLLDTKKTQVQQSFRKMRLMVSGSAALPVSVLQEWEGISGHVLLERYGMTEIGMALSNSYTEKRIPGHVGKPLPFVQTRVVDADYKDVSTGTSGELLVKGPSVFSEYWQKPEATKEAFTKDGWFKTGDVVQENENGIYKILGRQSVDIIKTGGYKVSALEIEEVLREHSEVTECAVVGLPSDEWGQEIAAAMVLNDPQFDLELLKDWLKQRLAPYKKPVHWKMLDMLPKNAMGKVVKPEIVKLFL
ncbi:acyl-CoA synthetase [Flavobacteriaceae bacterium S356]|uniref:Acyl-CoA synthetase n=1 Tax=Asprobacillus argus TaxID=3076534 RepID=A0ABU3LHL9_9FLAO|nr:acyl-CoA synthetase [Flavobacteriaceae bacterium S356]